VFDDAPQLATSTLASRNNGITRETAPVGPTETTVDGQKYHRRVHRDYGRTE